MKVEHFSVPKNDIFNNPKSTNNTCFRSQKLKGTIQKQRGSTAFRTNNLPKQALAAIGARAAVESLSHKRSLFW